MARKVARTIRIARLATDGQIEVLEVDNNAHVMHDQLGGYMEPFALPPVLQRQDLLGLADEDGQMKGLAYNPFSPLLGQTIVGPVLIVRSKVPEFVSLTDEDLKLVTEWFGRLLVLPL